MIEIDKDDLQDLIHKVESFNILDTSIGHAMGNLLVKRASARIKNTKSSPAGEKWADSKRSLILGRDALLKDTGNLLRRTGYSLKIWRKGFLVLDNNAEYAKFLQEGTKRTKKMADGTEKTSSMVARPFLGITEKDKEVISSQIEKYVLKKLN